MEFTLKSKINTTAKTIYLAWINSEGHTKMTRGEAKCSNEIGGTFTAWNGYIEGKNIVLAPYSRIVQSWRTTNFDKKEEDSQIEILLKEVDGTTELTLIHTNVPESGEHYIKGWEEHYFQPMKAFFNSQS